MCSFSLYSWCLFKIKIEVCLQFIDKYAGVWIKNQRSITLGFKDIRYIKSKTQLLLKYLCSRFYRYSYVSRNSWEIYRFWGNEKETISEKENISVRFPRKFLGNSQDLVTNFLGNWIRDIVSRKEFLGNFSPEIPEKLSRLHY